MGEENSKKKKETPWETDPKLSMEIKKSQNWEPNKKLSMRLKESLKKEKEE